MDHWLSKNFLIRVIRYSLIFSSVVFALVYAYTWKILAYDKLSVPEQGLELVIAQGSSLSQFTKQLKSIGALQHPRLLRLYLLYKGNTKKIKAGEYKISPGMTALQFLELVFSGSVTQYTFTIVEGWQTQQLLTQLWQHPKIKGTLTGLSDQEIINRLQLPISHLEGVFLADTYKFEAYMTDVDFLRRAYFSLQEKLQAAWEHRDPDSILKTPYEVLILASIIEKETSIKSEYAQISGVFCRRLAKNMKLQADPTVIYALRDTLNGPLLRKHLSINSPYNTYQKVGLPPTPIALPSQDAIEAALHPAAGNALYFVATGNNDGRHVFSESLQMHNKAVKNLYNLRKQP